MREARASERSFRRSGAVTQGILSHQTSRTCKVEIFSLHAQSAIQSGRHKERYLAGDVIVIGVEIVGCGEAEVSEELVGGEEEAGEDGEVERHQHGEVRAGVDRVHHHQQQRLQHLASKHLVTPAMPGQGGKYTWGVFGEPALSQVSTKRRIIRTPSSCRS